MLEIIPTFVIVVNYSSNKGGHKRPNAKITCRGQSPGGKITDRNSPVGLIDWLAFSL